MSSLDTVWARLAEVRALQFQSESRSATGWSGFGSGIVHVISDTPNVLIFEEKGEWQQNGGKQIRFSNRFRWSRAENLLLLEHLRFGASNPVFLFEMAPGVKGVWHDVTPHLCRDDCYSAILQLNAAHLKLDWSVHGPTRDETIGYFYF